MISDLNKKKHSSSRQELIDNLNRKLGKHNVSDFVNIETYKSEALSKEMLYDPSNDKNILHDEEKKLNENNKEMSRRAYMKVLQQVIENSDVIIQVLDARDPLSCRSKELESTILSHKDEKKIILVINKIDLIPM